MVQFDQAFFEDEIRDGWLVGSDMKRIWAAGIEVLMEIDRICKKYGISYFADFGTLLGAVRHNGYIPWDDDLDIVMFRDDYMKFLRVVDGELESSIICNHLYGSERWTQAFARVGNGVGVNFAPYFLKRFHGCPYPVGVDIFVLDEIPEAEKEFYLIKGLDRCASVLKAVIRGKEEDRGEKEADREKVESMTEEEVENSICWLEEMSGVQIDRKKNIVNQLLRIIDGLSALNAGNQSEEVFDFCFMSHDNYFYVGNKKEWYRETIELPFENIMLPVPIDYNKVLEQEFGNWRKSVKIFDHDLYFKMASKLRAMKRDVKNMNERIGNLESIIEKR